MKKLLLSVILFFTFHLNLKAANVLGGTLRYESLGNGKYLLTAKIYRDCRGLSLPSTTPVFGVYAGTNGGNSCGSYALTGFSRVAINEVTNRCSTSSALCSPANTAATGAGIEEHVFQSTVDFNSAPLNNFKGSSCCQVTFFATVPNALFFNLTNIDLNLLATLDICNVAKTPVSNKVNTSPVFSNPLQFNICCNQVHYEAAGTVDTIDFDSIRYRLEPPRSSLPATYVTYPSPFNSRYFITPYCIPLGNLNCTPNIFTKPPRGLHFDTARGDIIYTPQICSDRGVKVLAADEFRRDSSGKWLKIGTTMTVVSHMVKDDCGYNKSPEISGSFVNQVCGGDKICFNIDAKDETFIPFQSVPDTVKMTWDGAIPGATFTVTNPGSREKTAQFCWQTKPEHARGYAWVFTVSVTDQHCNRPAISSRSFVIVVRKPIKADTGKVVVKPCRKLVLRSSADTFAGLNQKVSWIVRDSAGKTIAQSAKARDTIDLQYSGRLFAYRTISNGLCSKILVDSLIVPAKPALNLGKDTSVCIGEKLTINPVLTGLENPVKYEWKLMGNALFVDTNPTLKIGIVKDTTVALTVSEASGCVLKDTLSIKMLGKSTRIFTMAIPALCANHGSLPLKPFVTTYGSRGNDTFWSNYSNAIVKSSGWNLNTLWVDNLKLQNGSSVNVKIQMKYTDTNGCNFRDSATNIINGYPIVEVEDRTMCQSSGDYLLRKAVKKPVSGFGIDLQWECINGPSGVDLSGVIDRTGSINAYDDKLMLGLPNEKFRTGVYKLVYKCTTKLTGCSDSDTTDITVLPNTTIEALPESSFCAYENVVSLNARIKVAGKYPQSGEADYNVFEFNSDNAHPNTGKKKIINDTLLQIFNAPGKWGIRAISDVTGCADSVDFYVQVHDIPAAAFSTNPATKTTMENPVFKTTNSTLPGQAGLLFWKWYMPGAVKERSIDWEPEIIYDSAGVYIIYLYTESLNGCRDTAQTAVTVEKLNLSGIVNQPANGMKINHLLQIADPDIDSEIKLYDAAGKLVFSSSGNKGITEFKGAPGVYLYAIQYSGKGKSGIIKGKVSVVSGS